MSVCVDEAGMDHPGAQILHEWSRVGSGHIPVRPYCDDPVSANGDGAVGEDTSLRVDR